MVHFKFRILGINIKRILQLSSSSAAVDVRKQAGHVLRSTVLPSCKNTLVDDGVSALDFSRRSSCETQRELTSSTWLTCHPERISVAYVCQYRAKTPSHTACHPQHATRHWPLLLRSRNVYFTLLATYSIRRFPLCWKLTLFLIPVHC